MRDVARGLITVLLVGSACFMGGMAIGWRLARYGANIPHQAAP